MTRCSVPALAVQGMIGVHPAPQTDHNSKGGTRGQRPPCPARPRRASPNEKGRRPRGVTPASTARPPRAVPSRKLQGGPTRAHHDRRRTTQSRAGCGHCPPPCLRATCTTPPRAHSLDRRAITHSREWESRGLCSPLAGVQGGSAPAHPLFPRSGIFPL